ncbi:hypothetical protein GCM10007425_25070 [Lysinibacillus alkalisoli]|uniref:Lactococcin 972 family bacteriocin n=1 Tax=Lysinibacillus alkalisoli TaxID=1911548 RepID=A0A917G9G5_9BACI|nr:hypothetical protein [Lysinibacillus alkalisoli]GGG29435.1 hypothetical protein GCM10007425_25070 [Lysinibacillus alkalisoli]
MKKIKITLMIVMFVFTFSLVVYAAKHTSGSKWVKNPENWHQLSYFGEAYTVKGYGKSQITYYRNGSYVSGAYAYVDSWSSANSNYTNVTVRDSLNPWAAKTTYYYSF